MQFVAGQLSGFKNEYVQAYFTFNQIFRGVVLFKKDLCVCI